MHAETVGVFEAGDLNLLDGRLEVGISKRRLQARASRRQVRAIGHVEDLNLHRPTVRLPVHGKVKPMLISEVARRSGVSAKTLRYYEDIGLLAPPRRTSSGYRDYSDAVLERLAFILSAQALGLTLGEIRRIVALRDDGEAPCAHVVELLQTRITDIQRTIGQLRALRSELRQLVERAVHLDPADCDPARVCQLIGPLPESGS